MRFAIKKSRGILVIKLCVTWQLHSFGLSCHKSMFFQVGLRSLKKMLLKYMVTSICFIFAIIPGEILGKNCVEGQYLSKSFINPDGACVACPPKWTSCYNEPINDQKRCIDSCRGRSLFHIYEFLHIPVSGNMIRYNFFILNKLYSIVDECGRYAYSSGHLP